MSLSKLLTARPAAGPRALSALSLARTPLPRLAAAAAPRRLLSIEETIKGKERAEEAFYFAKEEKALLKKLAKKMGKPEGPALDAEETAVKNILQKHGVSASKQCLDEIIDYFHTHP